MVKTGVLVALTLTVAAPQAADQASQADLKRRRDQVQMFEGVLTEAVRLGAQKLSRRMQAADPTLLMTTGTARARGFILEGYGVFFDVDIPMLVPSVTWAFKTLNNDLQQVGDALESLRDYVKSVRDPASRANLELALRRVELQVGPVQPSREATPPQQAPPPGGVAAADTAEAEAGAPAALDDPNAAYTEYVKAELIDAMLNFSGQLDLAPDEWMTIAARDSQGPLPGEIYDPATIVIRIKGSDIAAYHADKTKKEEIRKRVEVRVF
jgi:hypothetical protein